MQIWRIGFLLLAFSAGGYAQSKPVPFPGTITLLPGYRLSGGLMDSFSGSISKEHGLVIGYDIGLAAGSQSGQAIWNKNVLWRKEQVVRGLKVIMICNKQRRKKWLLIEYPQPQANFDAEIHSEQDIADMLLIALTYDPSAPWRDAKTIVAPGAGSSPSP